MEEKYKQIVFNKHLKRWTFSDEDLENAFCGNTCDITDFAKSFNPPKQDIKCDDVCVLVGAPTYKDKIKAFLKCNCLYPLKVNFKKLLLKINHITNGYFKNTLLLIVLRIN